MAERADTDGIPMERTRVRDKWGIASDVGYLVVPYLLLLNQGKLSINSEEMNVLINILAHWHSADRNPFPHSITIAKRMGVSPRSVQRGIKGLKEKQLLTKLPKKHRDDPMAYDLSPLVLKLRELASERIRINTEAELDTVDDAFLRSVTRPSAAEMFKDLLIGVSAKTDL
jgi:DNA replication protein DnaD